MKKNTSKNINTIETINLLEKKHTKIITEKNPI
jgi:hypothetical protein